MKKNNLTYRKSGVNIKAADNFVNYISSLAKKYNNSKESRNIGGFGSVSKIPSSYSNGYLVASTDGVGTKIEIANDLKKFDTIGIDLVAMSVNDLIVQGARPFIFLDYISIDKIILSKLKSIIRGISKGCQLAQCKLVGGETAEMPGTYTKGKFDLAGFSVGFVKKKNLLKKKNVKNKDLIIAVPSSGLHSNGYSLVRYIIKKNKINITRSKFLKKELIKPTKIYTKEILKLNEKKLIKICANITGGGLKDNIARIIPKGLTAEINLSKIKTLKIFKWIKKFNISDKEMISTFNCGIGFCIIASERNLKNIKKYFSSNFKPYIIGKITKGNQLVILNDKINWNK